MIKLLRWEKIAIACLFVTWAWWSIQSITFQRLLGDQYPVVGYFEIDGMTAEMVDGQSSVKLSGDAEKFRNCTWQSVHWFLSDRNGVPVPSRFLDPPKKNGTGWLHWDGLLVGISPDRITETYGEVTHRCGWFLVRSPFYVRGIERIGV